MEASTQFVIQGLRKACAVIAGLALFSGMVKGQETKFDAAAANNTFGWRALSTLQEDAPDENLVLSPFSIHQAMAMTYGGARGETETEMENTLGFAGQDLTHPGVAGLVDDISNSVGDERMEVGIANRLWLQEGWEVQQGYLNLLSDTYGSSLAQADFASGNNLDAIRNTINGWVADQTFDKIEELLPEGAFTDLTRWVLVNALAFKAPFAEPFDPNQTENRTFHVSEDESGEVRMMYRDGTVPYGANEYAEGIELELAGGDFSFLVLLPREDTTPTDIVGALKDGEFALDDTFFGSPKRLYIHLPRFEVDLNMELKELFESLGLTAPFYPSRSDFSGMTPAPDAYLQRIDHEASLVVVEGGIEAVAATSVTGGVTSVPPEFTVNRPFVFALRENSTGTVLFTGQVYRPKNPPEVDPGWKERAEKELGGSLQRVEGKPWYASPFGYIYPDKYPWIVHEMLGWVYVTGNDGKLWFWQSRGLGWGWTNLNTLYPYLYLHEMDHSWVYLGRDDAGAPILWGYPTEDVYTLVP